MYRALDAGKIIETAERLKKRVEERFGGRGIVGIADDVVSVAREAAERARTLHRPMIGLRLASISIALAIVGGGVWVFSGLPSALEGGALSKWDAIVTSLEAALSLVVFLGAAVGFLVGWEMRIKRRRALAALHELRALAQVIDMHQLTKDPDRVLGLLPGTRSSPKLEMSAFELGRYLDYCSEMLALISKIASIYGQNLGDQAAHRAVDQIEDLTTGLARKIWQKLMLLDRLRRDTKDRGPLAP